MGRMYPIDGVDSALGLTSRFRDFRLSLVNLSLDGSISKLLAESDLGAQCEWLGVGVRGAPRSLGTKFPIHTIDADLLVEATPDRLLHVEYMVSPEKNTSRRVHEYRSQIMMYYPEKNVTQVVVVLGKGRGKICDDPESGFMAGQRWLYIRELDPEPLLRQPTLAPYAALARGDEPTRARSFLRTLKVIDQQPRAQRAALLEAATTLAPITLPGSIIENIRQETDMTVQELADFYGATESGQELVHRGAARMLADLLRIRFGDDPRIPELAEQLATRSDGESPVKAVTEAGSLCDLL